MNVVLLGLPNQPSSMEEGTKSKKTVFVGGISEDTDETTLYEGFSTFGALIH